MSRCLNKKCPAKHYKNVECAPNCGQFIAYMPEHNTDSAACWCNPTIETDLVTGNKMIIHKDITV